MKFQPNIITLCLCTLVLGGLLFASADRSLADVTIGWDPNSEADLAGYGIYVSQDSPGPPFDHLGDVFIDELSDPDNPSVTLTEIDDDGIYYIAATAFDDQGDESDFSKQLCIEVSAGFISNCIFAISAADSAAGGGGGGG
jgi:hypothetical protein